MADSLNETDAQPWPDNESEYELKELIGIGSIAHVYCACCKPRREKCAIKIFDISKCNKSPQSLLHEVQTWSTYKHPNIVSYYASFIVKDTIWLVMTFLEGGSLDDTIKYKVSKTNCRGGVLDETTIATVLKKVLTGLEYLNNKGQSHRDIKAGNILVGDNGTVKITDFGISGLVCRRYGSKEDERGQFTGSAYWMAPEVMDPFQEETSYTKADMWSVGIAAIEMATGNPPYYKHAPMKVVKLTLLNDPPDLDTGADQKDQYKSYGKTFRKFIGTCLKKEPARRPTVGQLLQHPFLKRAQDRKLITQTVISVGPSYATRVQKLCDCLRGATDASSSSSSSASYDRFQENLARRALRAKTPTTPTISELEKSDGKRKTSGTKDMWSSLFRKLNRFESSHVLEPRRTLEEKGEGSIISIVASIPDMTQIADQPVPLEKLSSTDIDEKSPTIPIVLRYRRSRGKLEDIKFLFSPDNDTPEGIAGELVQAGLLKPPDSVPVGKYLNRLIETNATEPITFHLCRAVTSTVIADIEVAPGEAVRPRLEPRQPTADPVDHRSPIAARAAAQERGVSAPTTAAAGQVQNLNVEALRPMQRPATPAKFKNILFQETLV